MRDNITGVIYGTIIGDLLGKQTATKDPEFLARNIKREKLKPANNWSHISDRTLILINVMSQCPNNNIDAHKLANALYKWHSEGIPELASPPQPTSNLSFVIKQKDYLKSPVMSSCKSYKLRDEDFASNEALSSGAICGINKYWYQNALIHTLILSYDGKCVAASLLQSYLIHNLINDSPIVWKNAYKMCEKAIQVQSLNWKRNLMEFNMRWHTAMHYRYLSQNSKEEKNIFINYLLNSNFGSADEMQNSVVFGLMLSIIIIHDMCWYELQGKKLDATYFKERLIDVAMCGGDASSNCAIVGSLIGAHIGYSALPQDWINSISIFDREWVNTRIEILIDSHTKANSYK